ncbi:MAG: ABC transporter permease [Fimbriimonadaceae bacterium]|nr:ABC transporter permease [Fimbriimonadaceae bacterium]
MNPKASHLLDKYGIYLALVILVAFSAVMSPTFLNPENLRNIVNQQAVIGLVAIGMTLVVVTGGIDLSVGSTVVLSATMGLYAMNAQLAKGASEPVAVLVALGTGAVVGALCGWTMGVLVARAKLAPFIATLCGLVAFRSFALTPAKAGEVRSSSLDIYPGIGQGGLPWPLVGNGQPMVTWNILVLIVAAVLGWLILERTTLGRNMVAVGGNETAARLAGVRTERVKTVAYVLTGLLCGIGGFLQAARMNSVSTAQVGTLYELDAIAAVAIGGASLSGGVGSVTRTVVGVLVLSVIQNMLVTLEVSQYLHGAVKGAIILFAVLLQRGRNSE